MSKRIFSLFLAVCCVLTLLPAAAPGVSAAQLQPQEVSIPTQVNPLYADVLDVEDFASQLKLLERPEDANTAGTMATDTTVYCDMTTAAAQIREAMVNREETITVYYYADGQLDAEGVKATVSPVLAKALTHTGVATEGDYLLWQWGTYSAPGMFQYDAASNRTNIQFDFTFTYYTTAEQEAQMDTAVDALLSELALDGAAEYDQIKGIYDYICANVTYDYDNLNDDTYKLKYSGYAALVNKTAVCQGYAVLFYRLALELGLDARVITGTGNGGAHAWNIVQIGDYYYNLDSTWDAGSSAYSYFLTSDANFGDHTRGSSFASDTFYQAYPMSSTDYASGTCGENAYWSLENGVLTISGEGAMDEHAGSPSEYPWHPFKDQITAVVVESGVTNVGAFAFYEYTNMIEATLGVTTIGDSAFDGCTSLTTVTTTTILSSIGGRAFANTAITGIHLPDGLTAIGAEAFMGSKLTSVTIPGTVTEWGYDVFTNCTDLKHAELGEGLTGVYSHLFADCTALETVEIPGTATYIGEGAFKGCSALDNVVIPDGVTALYTEAFGDCVSLTSVEIPASVERMLKPFKGCTGLTEITFLGDAPVILDDEAFEGVTAIAYYPGDNATWTEEVMQQYGGTLTWVSSAPADGWIQKDGTWYYHQDGAPVTGWLKDGSYWYYLDSTGAMTTGWVKVGSNWFYMNKSGVMQTGWQKINGYWYYFASGGAMQTGWVSVGGKWYYMASGGAMQTGWVSVGGKWYYMDSSGAMQTGWIQLDGTWYYLTSSGAMATGWTHDGSYWYYMDEDGIMQTGWITVNGKWYYLNKSGVMQTGWLKDGGYWYYLDSTGAMLTGTHTINGKTYTFNSHGVWVA